jgi:hypothetical protein
VLCRWSRKRRGQVGEAEGKEKWRNEDVGVVGAAINVKDLGKRPSEGSRNKTSINPSLKAFKKQRSK